MDLIRHIKEQQPHIITLQETHISTPFNQERFGNYFGATQAFWTHSCGIISTCSDICITQLHILEDDRHLFTRVEHLQQAFTPFYLLTIYAPSASPTLRHRFFTKLYHSPIFDPPLTYSQRMIITGDFNYSYQRPDLHRNAPPEWFAMLTNNFFQCINNESETTPLPTFRRGNSTSTIDYIFASAPTFQNTITTQ
ncbi:hypothetical protein INT45_003110 [Circinella minor]|uniref:Endonuclease/exonuclease/phosphatase domain-containing protein n=1 Tax=Circinella minor TaxID=1195481 RepID=A0A8H7RJZ1_9FUNG|nr:hypothetical protein INT45_003110 [Circinella minor]